MAVAKSAGGAQELHQQDDTRMPVAANMKYCRRT